MKRRRRRRRRRFTMKRRSTLHRKTVFPLLLAAICSESCDRKALIRKCLSKIYIFLPHFHLSPILALLPSLLKSDCAEIVCKSAKIIGAVSLASLEMNEHIAMEDETVKSLISLLRSSEKQIAMAACNAVLDLSTASIGRQRLLEFNAIDDLVLCFIQESKSPTTDMTWLEEDKFPNLLLQGAIALINSSTIEQLLCLPTDLSDFLLAFLKGLWEQAYKQTLCSSSSRCNEGNEFGVSNIRTNNLVESIFRLSVNYGQHQESIDYGHIKKNIFDLGEDGIKPFLSDVWETSPMIIRNASKASLRQDGIFSPFLQYLGSIEMIPSVLPSILKCITSCPATVSDELDILYVIEEIKNDLGYPVIYGEDIRVVKTECGGRELHYFQEQFNSSVSLGPHILSINDILKCEEAFKDGYSIALRGMEFRYQTIATIADWLASLFGQPSAGVNMYLTPSNSQGLARHSDDHCVFVCQLIGVKRWTIFPCPDIQLPRLYESTNSSNDKEDESREAHERLQILLKEGDVLYIPRGFPHEARAVVDDDEDANNSTGFSLHLTLAIEIEPPFEWEGFLQVALYTWDKKQKSLAYKSEDSVQGNPYSASSLLLHIAIKLMGNLDPAFRKACLVGATSLSSDTRDWLHKDQRTTFDHLISRITSESRFADAASHFEAALQKNEDPLEHIRWMKYLEEETKRSQSLRNSSADSRYLIALLTQHKDIAEAAFRQAKSNFCNEVEFEDVEQRYKMLLEKYKKVRKQYTNGMLSLHSALHNEHDFSLP